MECKENLRGEIHMKKYSVTFTTYEEYEIEAENENEAKQKAIEELEYDRYTPIADTHYDEIDVEEIKEL